MKQKRNQSLSSKELEKALPRLAGKEEQAPFLLPAQASPFDDSRFLLSQSFKPPRKQPRVSGHCSPSHCSTLNASAGASPKAKPGRTAKTVDYPHAFLLTHSNKQLSSAHSFKFLQDMVNLESFFATADPAKTPRDVLVEMCLRAVDALLEGGELPYPRTLASLKRHLREELYEDGVRFRKYARALLEKSDAHLRAQAVQAQQLERQVERLSRQAEEARGAARADCPDKEQVRSLQAQLGQRDAALEQLTASRPR